MPSENCVALLASIAALSAPDEVPQITGNGFAVSAGNSSAIALSTPA